MRDLSRRHMEVDRRSPRKRIPETNKHLVTRPTASDWPSNSGESGRDGRNRDRGIDDGENGSIAHTGCPFLQYEIRLAWLFSN